jgi:ADP-ribose pyrophosphatase YjhB (NUDIX family)
MTWYPHATVATVVEQNGRYLMVEEHADDEIVFNQPAGHLEAGESLIAAAERETLEETGWEVKVSCFLGLYHYTSAANQTCYIRSCFIATPVQQHLTRQLDADIVQPHWLTLEEIRDLDGRLRSPVVLQVLDDYRRGIAYPLSLISTL